MPRPEGTTPGSLTIPEGQSEAHDRRVVLGALIGMAAGVSAGLLASGVETNCQPQYGIPCGHGTGVAVVVGGLGGAAIGATIAWLWPRLRGH
jgi:hypothetical protein